MLKGVGTAAKWGAGILTAATAAGAALTGMAMKSAEAMDTIDKGSQKVGISKKAYQEWSYVLGQNGMDVSKLESGMKSLLSSMDAAAGGSSAATERFDELGISIYDTNGKLKSQETMLNETLHALAGMENGSEKARLATELFGKAGIELMPMLNNGADSMDELTARAHELGLVVSDEAVDAGVLLGDTMDDAKQSFSAITTKLGIELMPMVQKALDWVLKHMPEIQGVVSEVFGVIGGVISALSPVVGALFSGIENMWKTVLKPVLTGILTFVSGVFSGDLKKAFKGLLTAIGGIWNGLSGIIKMPINAAIKLLNRFIGELNKLKIPEWVPAVGGKNLNIKPISYLYSGGVLERGQVGMLEGTGAEAVVPLENNSKWIRAVARDMGTALNYADDSAILERLDTLIELITMLIKLKQIPSADDLIGLLSSEVDRRLGKTLSFKERLVMT